MAIPDPRPGATALVTGASSGIGEALARRLAARGHHVLLVARRRERLDALAAELGTAEAFPCDVADAGARGELIEELARREIDVAVLSAGFGMGGAYLDHDRDRVALMVRTNVESTFVLSHAVLEGMQRRRRGALLLVSSMAGHQPMPHFGPYAATKAAVTSFAEMLSGEMRPHGVTVSALCPGGVRTEFSAVAGRAATEEDMPRALMMDAGDCADAALQGLERGDRIIMPKPAVRALAFFGAHAPRAVWLPLCRRMMGA